MKTESSIRVENRHIDAPVDSQTLLDILNVLETRHDLVNEQWYALRTELAALHEEQAMNTPSQQRKMSDRSLLMEQELSRYQRFFHILRQTLLRRRIHNIHFSANCEG